MIIDVRKFIATERGYWEELESVLERLDRDPYTELDLSEVRRFHYLYERVSADLARIATFASEQETRRYLGVLVGRAYGQIHETRRRGHRLRPIRWFLHSLPQTFRRHVRAFYLSLAVTMAGILFGVMFMAFDPTAKPTLIPYGPLQGDPTERVEREEARTDDHLAGRKAQGAAWYMTHNTKVSVFVMALGTTWGIGTIIVLFHNGALLGAICLDYIRAGQGVFLAGWLLPHGSVEIPAILLAGQAGLMLGGALIGWGRRIPLRARLRAVSRDLVTLIGGVALMLVWAGIIEAFLSQYHQQVIPYAVKIGFGAIQLALVITFFALCGRQQAPPDTQPSPVKPRP